MRRMALPNGLVVHVQNGALSRVATRFIYREIFVHRVYIQGGITVAEGAVVFDVGANIGLFPLFLSQHLQRFTVYAFEPIPETFAVLRRNTEPLADRIRLFNLGLSDHSGETRFAYFPRISGWSTCLPNPSKDAMALVKKELLREFGVEIASRRPLGKRLRDWPWSLYATAVAAYSLRAREVTCPLETLSGVIADTDLQRIDLLKIDVEGSEWNVLRGIEDDHWSRIDQIVAEVHDIDGRAQALSAWLADRGYRVTLRVDPWIRDAGILNLYARRRELGVE